MTKFLRSFLLIVQVFLLSGGVHLYASVAWNSSEFSSYVDNHTPLHVSDAESEGLSWRAAPSKPHKAAFNYFIDLAEVEEEEDDKTSGHRKYLKNPFFTSLFHAQNTGFFFKTKLRARLAAFEHFTPETSCCRHIECQVFRI